MPAGDVEVVEHQDSGPQLFNELLPEVGRERPPVELGNGLRRSGMC